MTRILQNVRGCARRLPPVAMASLGLLVVAVAQACNVPVFRFALERWPADSYRVTVVHDGALSPADKALITHLEERQEKSLANLAVRTLDVAKVDEAEDRELLGALSDSKFPALVLQYPAALKIAAPVWTSPLNASSVSQLLDSPLRRELLNRLVDGETAVWLLLECDNAEQNERAASLLQEQLTRLGKDLQLPELSDLPDDNLAAKTPLKLSFSMLRVPRSAVEEPLVQMLLRCEPDLLDRPVPMVFPVFGRGRALLPLIGAGITAENIQNSAEFLVGACSCEVKELNPGFDLLLSADWDRLLSQDGKPLPVVAPRQLPEGDVELVAIPAGAKATVDVDDGEPSPILNAADTNQSAHSIALAANAIYTIVGLAAVVVVAAVLANRWRTTKAVGQ